MQQPHENYRIAHLAGQGAQPLVERERLHPAQQASQQTSINVLKTKSSKARACRHPTLKSEAAPTGAASKITALQKVNCESQPFSAASGWCVWDPSWVAPSSSENSQIFRCCLQQTLPIAFLWIIIHALCSQRIPPFKPLAKGLFAWAHVHAKCSFVSLQLLWWISSTLHLLMTEVPTHTLHKCRWAGSNWGTPSAVVPRTGSWHS